MKLFKTKTLKVFHPESPGIMITVKRNFLQRIFYPRYFATINEAIEHHIANEKSKDKNNE